MPDRDVARYAVYAMPEPGSLADFGAAWLGWDALTGQARTHPAAGGLDVAGITATPRRYGFHGTIKAPFRLAPGTDRAGLEAALGGLCAGAAPATTAGLTLARQRGFLALVPAAPSAALDALAARCVTELDRFRAPPGAAELTRRRAAGLNAAQERNLVDWGYPHVLDQFRFHMTLSGRLPDPRPAEAWLSGALGPILPAPWTLGSLCLAGEGPDGRFRLIARVPLTGAA